MRLNCRPLGILIAGASLLATPAFAVHDDKMELDGNIVTDGTAPAVDWEDLFTTGSVSTPPVPQNPLPSGFGQPSFDRDFEVGGTSDDSYFATGSADVLNPEGGWQCKKLNNSGDKFDLLNVYAVPYTAANGDIIIYFGAERVKNEGVTNIGFWFFQDSNVGCVVPNGGAADFTGNHVDGDLFIVAEYTNGGTVNTIQVYRWDGGADGELNQTPVVSGADCKNASAGDAVCAIVNDHKLVGSGAGTDIPWLTQTFDKGKILTELDTGLFFEGGLNLKDFSLNEFNLCSLDASKTSSCVDFTSDSSGEVTFTDEAIITVLNDGGAPLPAGSVTCCDNAGTGEPMGAENESMTGDDVCFQVPNELSPDADGLCDVGVDCYQKTVSYTSSMNGGTNKVFCAADLGGGATTSDSAESETTACSASPDLYVDKECSTKLVFDDPEGRVVVKVVASGQVCNTSNDDDEDVTPAVIFGVTVTDPEIDDETPLIGPITLDYGTPCESDQDCTDAKVGGDCVGFDPGTGKDGVCRNTDDGTDGINGGDVCADYTGEYLPASTDDGTMVPGDAEFSDQVTAKGMVDEDLGTIVPDEMAAATCPLCPPCEDDGCPQ